MLFTFPYSEAATGGVLGNFARFTRKHLCQSLCFNKTAGLACNFIKIETLAQVFSCEFCEVSKNTFFTEHLWATASAHYKAQNLTILNGECKQVWFLQPQLLKCAEFLVVYWNVIMTGSIKGPSFLPWIIDALELSLFKFRQDLFIVFVYQGR